MTDEEPQWILARTKARREQYAAENIQRQGLPFYLPFAVDARDKIVPMFPSYIFVRITGRWRFLESTYGVVSVVKRSGTPEIVPLPIILELQARANRKGMIELPDPESTLGQTLLVRTGLLQGETCWYKGMTGTSRVAVLMEILGATRAVTLPLDAVEAAPAPLRVR